MSSAGTRKKRVKKFKIWPSSLRRTTSNNGAILIQQGFVDASKGETNMSTSMFQKEKTNKINKVRSTIIL